MMKIEKQAFEARDRGYTVLGYYLMPPDDGVAVVRFLKGDVVVKEAWVPAYKIWNVAAHADRFIDALIASETISDEQDMLILGNAVGGALSKKECHKHAPAVVKFEGANCPVCAALARYADQLGKAMDRAERAEDRVKALTRSCCYEVTVPDEER
jgi:hypothetical protein